MRVSAVHNACSVPRTILTYNNQFEDSNYQHHHFTDDKTEDILIKN